MAELANNNDVVVSDKVTNRIIKPRHIMVALIVVLLLAGLLAYSLFATTKPNKVVTFTNLSTPATYGSDTKALDNQIASATSPQAKAKIYDIQSVNAQSLGHIDDALSASTSAYKLAPTAARASTIGALYGVKNDWKSAVIWYQKAVDLTPMNTEPGAESDYTNYLNQLNVAKSHL
jgi:tetratricopeptide (TPR) repeat protein